MPTSIKSKQNELIQSLRLLQQKKGPWYPDYFLVEGDHLVKEAQQANAIEKLIVLETNIGHYTSADITISPIVAEALSQHKSPSYVFALCKKPTVKELSGTRLLYLDGLQDPGNVGTILRTALAFGFSGVLYHETTADPYGFKVIQGSQGALFSLPVLKIRREDLVSYQEKGYSLCGTTLDESSLSLDQWIPPRKIILLLGHEGHGLHAQSKQYLDQKIRIPMGNIDSLNVAIAFGIFAYTLRK
jgi:TrmH family RNA methyltransferase